MAITNQQNINQVQGLFPAVGPNPTDEGGLLRLANDGGLNATKKIAGGEGGPDFVCTALVTAADTVNFDIPWASLMKLYAAQTANVTAFHVRARVYVTAPTNVTANNMYFDVQAYFNDVAGTMVIVGAQVQTVVIEGTGASAQDVVLSNSGANLRCQVVTLGATTKNVRAEIFTKQAQ